MALEFQIVVDDKGSAKVQKFSKNIKKSGGASEKASKALKVFGASVGIVGAGAVAGAGALFSLAQKTAEAQDKITKMGRELGVSTEFLSSMQFSAKLAGTSLGVVDKGLTRLAKTAQDAQNGSAVASRAFDDLGVSVKSNDGTFKDADQLLFELSDKFKAMPDGVLKTAKAQEIFGKSGKQMINLLNQGSGALQNQAEEASRLGIVFDQEAGESAEQFNDQMLRIEETFSGMAMNLGTDLIPILTDLFDDILLGVENARPAIESFFNNMVDLVGFVSEELSEFVLGWSQIAKEINDFFGDEKEFKVNITPEGQARLERFEKAQALEKQAKKDAEKQARKEEKLSQQRELKGRKQAEQSRKRAQKNAEENRKKREREAESEAKRIIQLAEKVEQDRKEAEEQKIKDAEETAKRIIELNQEVSLSLMNETERSREISKIAHAERIKQGADEASSKKLHIFEISEISAQQEEARRQKREQSMQQISEGFSKTSEVLNNINQIEQNKIAERFEKRKEAIEETFAKEIKGAQGNADQEEKIKAKRDEALRQLEIKKNQEMEKASEKLAGVRKGVAIGQALINGALAVTRAYAEGGPFAGPVLAGLAGAVTATQVALISSQKFFEGGMIKGKDTTMITANENGTESILNARATSAVGESALNDFNSGRTQDALDKIQSSVSGSSSSGVVLNIQGGIIDKRFLNETLLPQLNKELRRR